MKKKGKGGREGEWEGKKRRGKGKIGRGKRIRGKGIKENEKVKVEKREVLEEIFKGCLEVDLLEHQNAPLYY